jgi:hypothetical protein
MKTVEGLTWIAKALVVLDSPTDLPMDSSIEEYGGIIWESQKLTM